MSTQLKSYPAYKDSGVPWLGEIPAHWESKPLKRWVRINAEVLREDTADDFEFRYLDIGTVGTGRLNAKPQTLRFGVAPSRARRVLRRGDTIISTVRTYLKAVFFVSEDASDLIASTGFAVLRPGQGVDPRFLSFLVQSDPFTDRVAANSVGTAYPAIAETRLGTFHVAIPPLAEQLAIARYLHHVDRRIRRAIRAKQKLIALLNEQKQAIIHQAVTRGLDPNVRLKPSGVEWLGKVPEHWEIAGLARLTTRIGDGLHGTPEYVDESGYHFINGNNLSGGVIKITPSTRCISEVEFQKYKIALDDSTILMSINGTIGNVAFYRGESVALGKSAAYINCDKSLARSFLFFFLQSLAAKEYFQLELTGTTIFNLSLASIRNLRVALPPLTEQTEISSFLEVKMAEFDDLVECARREIALLREYRTRLIADVVTGKVDVRAAARGLPDEVEEMEPIDEMEAQGDTGEETTDDLDAAPGEDA